MITKSNTKNYLKILPHLQYFPLDIECFLKRFTYIFGLKPGAKTYYDVILFLFAKIVLKRKVFSIGNRFYEMELVHLSINYD